MDVTSGVGLDESRGVLGLCTRGQECRRFLGKREETL